MRGQTQSFVLSIIQLSLGKLQCHMDEEKNLNHSHFFSPSLQVKRPVYKKIISEYSKWIYEAVKFYNYDNYDKIIAGPIWHKIQLTNYGYITLVVVSHHRQISACNASFAK